MSKLASGTQFILHFFFRETSAGIHACEKGALRAPFCSFHAAALRERLETSAARQLSAEQRAALFVCQAVFGTMGSCWVDPPAPPELPELPEYPELPEFPELLAAVFFSSSSVTLMSIYFPWR